MSSQPGNAFAAMGREDLLLALEMFAKNWLAHDGCWFLAAEERFDMETAIDLDARSWKRFASAEARRIMTTFNIPAGGGLHAPGKSPAPASLRGHQHSTHRMVGRPQASALLHGSLSSARRPAPQGSGGFALQKCGYH